MTVFLSFPTICREGPVTPRNLPFTQLRTPMTKEAQTINLEVSQGRDMVHLESKTMVIMFCLWVKNFNYSPDSIQIPWVEKEGWAQGYSSNKFLFTPESWGLRISAQQPSFYLAFISPSSNPDTQQSKRLRVAWKPSWWVKFWEIINTWTEAQTSASQGRKCLNMTSDPSPVYSFLHLLSINKMWLLGSKQRTCTICLHLLFFHTTSILLR